MIHSWTRKCFPYSTSGLKSVERVMGINVHQYHSERFTHRDARFMACFWFSFSIFSILFGILHSVSSFLFLFTLDPFLLFLSLTLSLTLSHTHTVLQFFSLSDTESHMPYKIIKQWYGSDRKVILALISNKYLKLWNSINFFFPL